MAKKSSEEKTVAAVSSRMMFGRRVIFSSENTITDDNVAKVVEQAYVDHLKNRDEIDYLWNYYKGKQPNLFRTRTVRNELTSHVVENRASEVVSFKVGYIAGKPLQYISSANRTEPKNLGNGYFESNADEVSKKVSALNDYMRIVGKATKDRDLIEWCMICGLGYRYVVQNTNPLLKSPFNLYTLDPRNTFVIRKNDFSQEVIAGVNYVTDKENNVTFTVYTADKVYTIEKGTNKASGRRNSFGLIPIIEYQNNSARQGCFEICLSLLDAISEFDACRLEAVEAFCQSLMVLYNCQIDDGVTADSIRAAGLVMLKSTGDNKADIKILAEQLDQAQNQTLKEDMYNAILQICGVPSQSSAGTSDSSNNGAVVLRNGWEGAETRAQDFETGFKLPEREMLQVVAVLCRGVKGYELDFDPSDIDVKFTRRNYENILSKSQTLTTMLGNDKIHPQKAYEASGLFVDTEEAYQAGMQWYNEQQKTQQTEVKPDGNTV